MPQAKLDDLEVLLTVAREGSFTRAAALLGVSQSALSQTVRAVEARIGIRLLDRTTRSVAPTEAGARLLERVSPKLEEIRTEIAALSALKETPAGTIRITAAEHGARTAVWPRLASLLKTHPDVNVEIIVDYGLTDIVAERYDAGVRLGGIVAKDMIAVPIGPEQRMIVVAAPAYLQDRVAPTTPQDLMAHSCINLRLPTHGGLYAWELEKDGHEVKVRVEGQCVFNTLPLILEAALDGLGFAFVPQEAAQPHLAAGTLCTVLEDWCPSYPGFHLFYSSRRQPSAAFALVVDTLRYRA
jgi:DNA-binding transcriptional LysR family regulator